MKLKVINSGSVGNCYIRLEIKGGGLSAFENQCDRK